MNARELEQAQYDLDVRRQRAIQAAALACAAAVTALGLLWLSERLSIALAAGAAALAVVAAAVFLARREQIARLALEPAAYAIPDVGRHGHECECERERLAAWLAEIVADARRPGNIYLSERVASFADDLDTLAHELASPAAKVQPVSAVACRRLLTHAVESPLYNPRVPPDELWIALRRIRNGIQKDRLEEASANLGGSFPCY